MIVHRRKFVSLSTIVPTAGCALLLATCVVAMSSARAAATRSAAGASAADDQVVIGIPLASVSGLAAAGSVDIRGGTADAPAVRVDESDFPDLLTPAAGDRFGQAVSLTHLDHSDVSDPADLVIGAPGTDDKRGTVIIARGSTDGVTANGAIRLSGRSASERFGASVAATGNDVWVGVPNRTVAGQVGAGAVDHYRISGSQAQLVQTLTQDTPGIAGTVERGDHFGQMLDVDPLQRLVIGDPGENVGTQTDAGAVAVVYTNRRTGLLGSAVVFAENAPYIPGIAEEVDHFGESVSIVDGAGSPARSLVAVGNPGGNSASVLTVRPGDTPARRSTVNGRSVGAHGYFGQSVVLSASKLYVAAPGAGTDDAYSSGVVVRTTVDGTQALIYRQGGTGAGDLGEAPTNDARAGTGLARLGTGAGTSVLVPIPGADHQGLTDSGKVVVPAATEAGPMVYEDSAGATAYERYGIPAHTD